ncbi:MAG: hypothetical protein J6B07_01855 [Opitutales bacterium]|nr:hypothetical protein [Opitutales bacterium]
MSELEKIQQHIKDEISEYIELSDISVLADVIDKHPIQTKSFGKIIVMRPLPISTINNADYPVFDKVEIKIIVQISSYKNMEKSILYYCETLCKKLHNFKISTKNNIGKILLAKENPIEITSKNSQEIATINFIINGVKI